jgi:hypothetical protein
MALLTATLCGADETFPVVHNEPITVRILGGKDGQPLAYYHLLLIAGYDQNDLHDQLYRQELLTDAHGHVRLPKQLANLPWLQVWIDKKSLCQAHPRRDSFSVELIRRDGLSAPNRCGTVTVGDAPGVFNVFVKSSAILPPRISSIVMHTTASFTAPIHHAAPHAEPPATKLIIEAPAPKPVVAEVASPAPQPPAAVVVATVPVAPAPVLALVPVVEVPNVVLPTQTAAIALAVDSAKSLADVPAKPIAHSPVKRVARRPIAHRRRPPVASCLVPAETKVTPVRTARKPASTSSKPIVATRKPKPSAGVKLAATTHGKRTAPQKQE